MRGSLKQRAKGSWEIRIELPHAVTGKRQRETLTVRGTKKDAERKLAELIHQADKGGYVRPAKLTLGEYLCQWARDWATTHVRARTLEGYRGIIEHHLVPNLGGIPLSHLQASHLDAYYAERLERGRLDGRGESLSARSVLHHHRVIHEALEYALRAGLVVANVAERANPPRPQSREMRTLDRDGLNTFLEATRQTPYYTLFLMASHTGLRRSELLGLRWKDMDLDLGTLSVVQTLHHLKDGRTVFEAPKSAKGRRMVALTPSAALTLKAHRERLEADLALLGTPLVGDRLVFSNLDGNPFLPDTITHVFVKIARRAGLPGIRFHDLRHTHASLMLKQGIHPKIVSERLGHSTVSITLDTYSHVLPGLQEAAALRFEDALLGHPARTLVQALPS